MNKHLSTNALAIFVSLLGVCSFIAPASALTGIIKTITQTPVTKTVESVTQTTSTTQVGNNVTAAVQQTTNTTVGQVVGVASNSQTTSTTQVGNNITATVQETTNTTVGKVAGVGTDSTTTAQLDPSQIKLPSLDNLAQTVQTTGGATVGIQSNQQSTQADAEANLGVKIGDFATAGICLDASATLGILNQDSSANCPKDVKTPPTVVETPPAVIETPPTVVETPYYVPIKVPSVSVDVNSVPEPATLGGLALLGVYFTSRRRQIS
ncbi:MAG: PEP-CTERM sorting domain-containing protein [Nostoc sp. ChiSLP02]|nr:PEP-CTERM sorting domain-containing protein [Nostoc sp. DedSLP05]MDZ8103932.1 PEP-CTERM sorting domain-containing protein [Nostoc sp. DedSLP01]MDZ8187152.1 PEP-CTERM sorting domain-containing protein [Nostoc sp. ChiSLP02]